MNPWRENHPDEREVARLELVGLACEVAVVTGHIEQDLVPLAEESPASDDSAVAESSDEQRRSALELKESCGEHRRSALQLLSQHMRFDELTREHLHDVLAAFRERQRQVVRLRSRVNRLLHGIDDELWCSTYQ